MKNVFKLFYQGCLILVCTVSLYNCSEKEELINDETDNMVLLDNIYVSYDVIDYDDNNLFIFDKDQENEDGVEEIMFTDRTFMKEWLNSKESGNAILDLIEKQDALQEYISRHDILNSDLTDEAKSNKIMKFWNKINSSEDAKVAFNTQYFNLTSYNGLDENAQFSKPKLILFNDYIDSFKAWSTGTGWVTFYNNYWFQGSRKLYFVPFYKQKSSLGSFNNKASSLLMG